MLQTHGKKLPESLLIMLIRTIHPFPARMAPELALSSLQALAPGSIVLDPMSGSGTVLRQAVSLGHTALGFDMDPLAVLMSRVWTTPISPTTVESELSRLVAEAAHLDLRTTHLHWHDDETREFAAYWFAARQRRDLTRLAAILAQRTHERLPPRRKAALDVLRLALSRLIVTKDQVASLARDTSHSRPHRVTDTCEFDVFPGLGRSVTQIVDRLALQCTGRSAVVRLGDARNMRLADGSVDAVMTSPPYLNQIDYMRGHRLSLIWLGYSLAKLRGIRGITIGAERSPNGSAHRDDCAISEAMLGHSEIPPRTAGMVMRYAADLRLLLAEIHRVLKPGCSATLVVGNSCLKDVFVRNASGVVTAAELAGLELVDSRERELPAANRYLPMTEAGSLSKRMRTEVVLQFKRAA